MCLQNRRKKKMRNYIVENKKATERLLLSDGVPTGIRTPVPTVKGSCPRPLDDGDLKHFSFGGGKRIRTADPLHAMQVLYQLSYTPKRENEVYRSFFRFASVFAKIFEYFS